MSAEVQPQAVGKSENTPCLSKAPVLQNRGLVIRFCLAAHLTPIHVICLFTNRGGCQIGVQLASPRNGCRASSMAPSNCGARREGLRASDSDGRIACPAAILPPSSKRPLCKNSSDCFCERILDTLVQRTASVLDLIHVCVLFDDVPLVQFVLRRRLGFADLRGPSSSVTVFLGA